MNPLKSFKKMKLKDLKNFKQDNLKKEIPV